MDLIINMIEEEIKELKPLDTKAAIQQMVGIEVVRTEPEPKKKSNKVRGCDDN